MMAPDAFRIDNHRFIVALARRGCAFLPGPGRKRRFGAHIPGKAKQQKRPAGGTDKTQFHVKFFNLKTISSGNG
jgi:hypothetical protein